jgi:hypothetical protein
MNHFANYISRNTLIRSMAALSILGVACMTASAQTLTLDNFTQGRYTKILTNQQPTDTHYESLGSGSPLGAARGTVFSIGPDQYDQASTLAIGKGIILVDAGFQTDSPLEILYGVTTAGVDAPMGLNLGSYSGLQLNFKAISTDEALDVLIEIDPASGGYYTSEVELSSTPNPSSVSFPYTSFLQGGTGNVFTQADASNINYIYIILEATWSSFGMTSFKAVN